LSVFLISKRLITRKTRKFVVLASSITIRKAFPWDLNVDLILTSISGANEGCCIVISAGECVSFGRSNSAQHVFAEDRTMSNVHFEIEHLGKASVLRDKGSTNGTWLNSKRIAEELLKSGDKILAGLTTFEVRFRQRTMQSNLTKQSDLESTLDQLSSIESNEVVPKANAPLPAVGDSSLVSGSNVTDEILHQLPEFCMLRKRLSVTAEAGIPIIVDSVCREWSVYAVVHLLKIRQRVPAGDFISLWSFHGSQMGRFGPVALPWSEFKKTMTELLPRLIEADAIVFFAGRSAEEVANWLKKTSSAALTGFSEYKGLLPIAWPSSLVTMLDVKRASGCKQLFDSSIAAAIFASPWDEQTIVTACTQEFANSLSRFSFNSVSRFFD
jgi:pSer/pThr/pTyr-binding forkhead associated (FHA) protein